MTLSEIIIKIIGIILAVIGISLILNIVGVNLIGSGFKNIWIDLILGILFIGAGIWIIRGGNITL